MLGGRIFLGAVITAFVVQAGWLALVARTSIYDEDYHLAAVDAFAGDLTPFLDQRPDVGPVGDVERYPSYLYHYLLSFPWRATSGWQPDDRMVLLRLFSVAMVAAGLVLWHRVVRSMTGSAPVAGVTVMLVSMSPLLVTIAAVVNYDNLLFLLVAAFSAVAVRLWGEPRELRGWLALLALASVTALTKYSALPFLAVVVVLLVVRAVRSADRWSRVRATWTDLLLVAAALVGLALAVERYVVNLVRFGTPFPDCGAVQPLETCMSWGPWGRNYEADAGFDDLPLTAGTAGVYAARVWAPRVLWLWNAVGVDGGAETFTSNGPAVAGLISLVTVVAGAALLVLLAPLVLRVSGAAPLLLGTAAFVAALFWTNLHDYLAMGQPIGVHARYLLTFLPIVVGPLVAVLAEVLRPASGWRELLVVLALAVGTQGAGASAFMVVSSAEWWRPVPALVAIQEDLSGLLRHIVLEDLVAEPRPDPRSVAPGP
ncbi:DUF2142 domain-containing protein [Cellulosimicrobium sp. CUA-896]|uniref:phospholipid carrier-dependent glycosyltransferase n=1 Tax=Cellulosimicrobium sp. CUA-896 TaxID=1517881 RepID=UPI001301625E|nr:DUF2142 domain-containing protein [Cellulosimicrobium sp. CUA-896]